MHSLDSSPATRRSFALALGGALAAAMTAAAADAAPAAHAPDTLDVGPSEPIIAAIFTKDTAPIRIDVLDPFQRVTHTFSPAAGSFVYGQRLPAATFPDPKRANRRLAISAVDTSNASRAVSVVFIPGGPFPMYGIDPQAASATGGTQYAAVLIIATGS